MTPVEFRRALHRRPELSFQEHETQQFIIDALHSEGIPYRVIAGTGVLAVIEGKRGGHERAVVLRADIDALPIEELNDIEYHSENKGIMHACGHDMHALRHLPARRGAKPWRSIVGAQGGALQGLRRGGSDWRTC